MAAVPPYGVAIRTAIASSDIGEMKRIADEARKFLDTHGDISAALEALKIEIAKHEGKG